MTINQLEGMIEAILFTLGEAIEPSRLAQATEQDEDTIRRVIHTMMDKYAEKDHGIQIVEVDGAFQMCTKPEMYDVLIKIAHVPKRHVLTEVMMETLAIIAYKQPITKAEIEHIRGVKTDHAVNKLVEYNLICEAGRLDTPGRPILFKTTDDFLRNFGIESLKELPVLGPEQLEDFKHQAEEEAQLQLDI